MKHVRTIHKGNRLELVIEWEDGSQLGYSDIYASSLEAWDSFYSAFLIRGCALLSFGGADRILTHKGQTTFLTGSIGSPTSVTVDNDEFKDIIIDLYLLVKRSLQGAAGIAGMVGVV